MDIPGHFLCMKPWPLHVCMNFIPNLFYRNMYNAVGCCYIYTYMYMYMCVHVYMYHMRNIIIHFTHACISNVNIVH